MDYLIRLTTLEDLPQVRKVYEHARFIMRESGNSQQWVEGYPQENIIREDIFLSQHYLIEKEGMVIAVFAFIEGEDPTYQFIEGQWLNDEKYGVIHRLGSLQKEKGILKKCIDYCFERVDNIRVDTHEDNAIMRYLLVKYGFTECGVIYLQNGSPRIAYQKNNKSHH
ncbi:MAG TPA: GNAT family N-acetyltransferase [Erysipelotrichaceae bacterium]|nr:GNAT family N-acetyltransferase [Erysipelotrichaceae bacterium]